MIGLLDPDLVEVGHNFAILVLFIALFIYCKIIFHIYKNYKNRFEPMNVFWLNFFIISSLLPCFYILKIIDSRFSISQNLFDYCPLHYFGIFVHISFNLDVACMQIDRFLAIYWDIQYKSRVTTNKAILVCLINKLVSVVITAGMVFINPGYGKCGCSKASNILLRTTSTNIYLDAYPKLVVFVITFGVSLYMLRITRKLQNSIQPVVNLPVMPGTSSSIPTSTSQPPPNKEYTTDFEIRRIAGTTEMFLRSKVDKTESVVIEEHENVGCFIRIMKQ